MMAEMVIDQDPLNLEYFDYNDYDFNPTDNLDQLDIYLNKESENNLESNIVHSISSLLDINNNNYGLNPIRNQWLNTNELNTNQYIAKQFEVNQRVNQLTDPYIGSTHSFAEPFPPNTYYNQNQIFETFSPNRYNNDYHFNDSLIQQNTKTNESVTKELSALQPLDTNESQADQLPEPVTQLNGQILSTQEFEQQNYSELFCGEQLESSMNSNENCVQSEDPTPIPSNKITNQIPVDNNNDMSVIGNKSLPSNRKTYSRVWRVIKKASIPPPPTPLPPPPQLSTHDPNMTNETMAAVKGLVMLSNTSNICRLTVIQSKAKKGSLSHMSYAEKQRIKRERNRIASKKCRQKKIKTIERLEELQEFLMKDNQKCENYLKNQRQKLIESKLTLLKHRLTDCQLHNIHN